MAAKNALLIGPSYEDLKGIDEDIRLMTELLERKGFSIEECLGPAATRAGILAAYESLITRTAPGDAVVVYYSGHGSIVDAPQLDLQYIVPTDFVGSDEDAFHGIASVELSILQSKLTDITPNVTVILDCCHAGFMSRSLQPMVRKSRRPVTHDVLQSHLGRLIKAGLPVEKWSTEGNPHAVRITACTTRQVAYEHEGSLGRPVGLLTECLARAVEAAGDNQVTWADVMDLVRQSVIDTCRDQRPAVEGPSHRLLFSDETRPLLASLPVRTTGRGTRLRLECAPLFAVQVGDEFAIMPANATRIDDRTSLGHLIVTDVGQLSAEGDFTLSPERQPDDKALIGARAFRTVMMAPRLPVRVSADDPRAAEVVAALEQAPMARMADRADTEWLAAVRIDADGQLTLWDQNDLLYSRRPAGAAGVAELMADLQIMAGGAQLRRLAGSSSLSAKVSVEWGRVVDGQPQPMQQGSTLSRGDLLYVRVDSSGTNNRDVYVGIIDIGVSGKISVVTGEPGGWMVRPGQQYTLGRNQRTGALTGSELSWPDGLARDSPRPETLLVFVMSERQDLRAVERPGITFRSKGGGVSPLLGLLNQVRTGHTRDIGKEQAEDFGYDVHEIRFNLTP